MFDSFKAARFVVSFPSMLMILVVTSFMACVMLLVSRDNTVRSEDVSCVVGEAIASGDKLAVKLTCQEGSVATDTSTTDPKAVMEILQSRPERVTCNVMQTGWARACRMP